MTAIRLVEDGLYDQAKDSGPDMTLVAHVSVVCVRLYIMQSEFYSPFASITYCLH